MVHPQSTPRGLITKQGYYVKGLLISANTTAVSVPALSIGSLASYITANTTGIKIGSRYISTNTTGNTST